MNGMHADEAGHTLEVLTFGVAIVFSANSDEEDERHDVSFKPLGYIIPFRLEAKVCASAVLLSSRSRTSIAPLANTVSVSHNRLLRTQKH